MDHEGKDVHQIDGVVDLVGGDAFKKAILKVPQEYWALSEDELKILAKPTLTDRALRLAFWNEARIAMNTNGQIAPCRIYQGICTYANWHQNVLNRPEKLAWLLQPVRKLDESLEPLTSLVAERYHEILSLDIRDKDGRPVPALIRQVLIAAKAIEARVRPVTSDDGDDEKQELSVEEMQEEIKKLESSIGRGISVLG